KAGSSDRGRLPMGVREDEGVKVRPVVDQTPDVRLKHKRREVEAMVLRPVIADDVSQGGPAFPWKPIAPRLSDPTAVGVHVATFRNPCATANRSMMFGLPGICGGRYRSAVAATSTSISSS